LPGLSWIRFFASSSDLSRSPNLVAPVGQASAHAVCLPSATRLLHMMHLRTPGTALFHSYLGTPKGQAAMQYRHPMQRLLSYVTGPSAVFFSAPTGQTEAQAGSSQFMHKRRMNLSSLVRTTVYLCADVTSSAAIRSS